MTKADTNHLQAFHMRFQRRILGVRWFRKVKNVEITRRHDLSHIRDICGRRLHAPLCPFQYVPQASPGHFDGSSAAGGLEETQGASSHNMDLPAAAGQGQACVDVVTPGARSSAVCKGRHSPRGLREMRRRRRAECYSSNICRDIDVRNTSSIN